MKINTADKKKITRILSKNNMRISSTMLDDLFNRTEIQRYKKNEILVEQGEVCRDLFLIIKGMAHTYYILNNKVVTDWFACDEEFITSIDSFFTQKPAMLNIEILEDSKLLRIPKDQIEELYEKYHQAERLGRLIVTDTMLKLQRRIKSLQFKSAKEKYIHFVKHQPEVSKRAPLGLIASYLGITQETLSRIRSSKI